MDRAILACYGWMDIDPGHAELVPPLYTPILTSTFKDLFAGASTVNKAVELTARPQLLPPDATLRIIVDAEPNAPGQLQFALNNYLRDRGDANIRSIADLIQKSTFVDHPSIEGSTAPAKSRLQGAVTRTERLRKKSDGSPLVQRTPITNLDITELHAKRVMVQMLVLKVMADHKLDALVYPTKTLTAPLLGSPEESQTIKAVSETMTVTIDGEEYLRTVERVLDTRNRRAWRLSPFGGLPAIAVPAGFTQVAYDRAPVRNADGSVRAGELVSNAVALPMTIDFLGRPFSEATLIKIAAAYENVTRHRRPPKAFPPVAGEP